MKISELISSLEQKKEELGDVSVFVNDCEEGDVEIIGVHSSCIDYGDCIDTNPQVLLVP